MKVAACGVCFHDVVTRNGTLKAGIKLDTLDLLARCDVRAQIGERFPLEAATDAHRMVESAKALGRVIVKPH